MTYCRRLSARTTYTQAQKLSNVLQQCTAVQTSESFFHKTSTGGRFIYWSTSIQHAISSTRSLHHVEHTRETCSNEWEKKTTNFASTAYEWNSYCSRDINWSHQMTKPWFSLACNYQTVSGIIFSGITRQLQVSSRSYQALWGRINTQGRFCTSVLGLVLFHSLKQTNSMEMSNISTANKQKTKTKKIAHRVSDLKNHYQLSEIGIWLIWWEYETH